MTLVSDLDVYRAASVLLKQHGDEAPIHATMRGDDMLEKGDMDSRAVWLMDLFRKGS